jgi:hypothetical protein
MAASAGLVALPQAARSQAVVRQVTTQDDRTTAVATTTTTTTYRRVVGTPVEVRAFDRGSRTITVLNGDKQQSFVIAGDAPVQLDELAPGQLALLSWRFNRDGKAEAIIRVTPATVALASPQTLTRTKVVRTPGPVEVIAVDRDAGTLTIRDERGGSQTVPVHDLALVSLGDLKPGDSVLLSWGDDRVLVITSK